MREHDNHKPFTIFIDKQKVEVSSDSATGAEVRALIHPPIGPDRDLYLVVSGGEDDLIEAAQVVRLKPGTKFMSVPRLITPGAS